MKVWRIQHDCSRGHGPVQVQQCSHSSGEYPLYPVNRPLYGTRLNTPQSDELLGFMIHQDEYVGTTPEQFPEWWARDYNPETGMFDLLLEPEQLPEDWWAILYDVPDSDVRVGHDQVLFKMDRAEWLEITQTDFPRY